MKRVVIFGNSGSGKSTLAREIAQSGKLPHLDLDTLAWLPADPPARKPLAASAKEIDAFTRANPGWVIEGCYADLLAMVIPASTEIIYLKLPVEDCVANARRRPWEPHKYATKEAQDANLEMLVDWIRQYAHREDTFSQRAHETLYADYAGPKTLYTSNRREPAGA